MVTAETRRSQERDLQASAPRRRRPGYFAVVARRLVAELGERAARHRRPVQPARLGKVIRPGAAGAGISALISDAARLTRPGASAWTTRIALARMPTLRYASPRAQARRMRRAAEPAATEETGSDALMANHATSSSCRPLNTAFQCEPVRMTKGSTVVTRTPSRAASMVSPSEKLHRGELGIRRRGAGAAPPRRRRWSRC